jgi:hypothetical protein
MGRGRVSQTRFENIRCSGKKKNSFSGNIEMDVRKIDRTGNVNWFEM